MIKKIPRVTVGALVFNKHNKILLLKSPKWKGKYIAPSGHVEYGETLVNAVKREVFEETGLKVNDVVLLNIQELIQSTEYYKNIHVVSINFTCKSINENVKLNNEAVDYIWLDPKDALQENIDSLTRKSITDYLAKQ